MTCTVIRPIKMAGFRALFRRWFPKPTLGPGIVEEFPVFGDNVSPEPLHVGVLVVNVQTEVENDQVP